MVVCRFEFRVRENLPADTEVGQLTAEDRDTDPHNRIAFSLHGSHARTHFRLDPDSGRLYTRRRLDRELRPAYLLTVGVRSVAARPSATAQVSRESRTIYSLKKVTRLDCRA